MQLPSIGGLVGARPLMPVCRRLVELWFRYAESLEVEEELGMGSEICDGRMVKVVSFCTCDDNGSNLRR